MPRMPMQETGAIVMHLIFTLFGILGTYGCLFHWFKMQKRFGRLFSWGRGWFPASKYGGLYGAITALLIGVCPLFAFLKVDFKLPVDSDSLMLGFILSWIALGIFLAIHDYRLHRKSQR